MKCFRLLAVLLLLLLATLRPILAHSSQVNNSNRVRCLERERQALLNIKSELVDTYGRLSSWGNDESKRDCCEWSGIQCHNQTNHVTRLDLVSYGLRGKISTSLLELQHLRYLELSFNDFEHGRVPEFIGSLTKLRHLNLAVANFSGPIPRQIGNLSKLLYFDIFWNDCYSENLDWVFNLGSLEILNLNYTNLSRANNWLEAVSKLTSIKELRLHETSLPEIPLSLLPEINGSSPLAILQLSGNPHLSNSSKLIHWFSNFSTGLISIDLSNNNMHGPILDAFENMISLKYLNLGANDLEGGLPKYFGNLSSLTVLDLGVNDLAGDISELMMNLSGPVEKKLEYFHLFWNNLSGLLPNMSRFSSLSTLDLHANQLSGTIREDYLQLPHLTRLDLSSNRITGPVPNLSFCSSLEHLYLAENMLNGTLTPSIGLLSRLRVLDLSVNKFLEVEFSPHWVPLFQLEYLSLRRCKLRNFPTWLKTQKRVAFIDISDNEVSDMIPSWFGGIASKLIYMNASNNQIYGFFPDLRDSLRPPHSLFGTKILDISRNKISGSITFLCDSREWMLLDLSDNLFSGQIPDCFTNLRMLKYLSLANNYLSGEIPHSVGSMSALTLLHLRNNSLLGGLPTSMRNCTGLEMIDVGDNRLTGKIPDCIGDSFPKLRVLILRSNAFYGSMPSNLCRLANLQILDISSNKVSGAIPECLQAYTAMTDTRNIASFWDPVVLESYPVSDFYYLISPISFGSAYFMWKGKEVKYINHLVLVKLIDFSDNNLVGEIPSNITKLVGLVALNISRNKLTGPIPSDIGHLESLNFLDLSRNRLSGVVPAGLGDMSHLGVLDLSYNNLSGRIPLSNHGLTFDASSYVGNVNLCGKPLNKSCPKDESLQDPDLRVRDRNVMIEGESEDDRFITEGFYVALGLGFVVGFWSILGIILLNRRFRYAFFKQLDTILAI